MFKLLDSYIAKTILLMTLLVLAVLVGIDFFIHFVQESSDFGKGDYNLFLGLKTVIYSLPADVYQFFPMIGLLGCLLGLGTLAAHSELVVMRAAGFSVWQISRSVLIAAGFLVLVVTLFGETLAPKLMHHALSDKALARSQGQAIKTQHGMWLREGDSFYHIAGLSKDGHLNGLTRYQFDKQHHLQRVSYAKHAEYQDNAWTVKDVEQTILTPKKVTTETKKIDQWKIDLAPVILKVAQVDAEEMSLAKLYSVTQYKKRNNLDYQEYALNFWQRILQPFSTLVMMLIAIPFIFGPLRTVSMGSRIVVGIIVGFGFFLINQFFGPLTVVMQMPPFLAALLPPLLFAGIGGYLYKRSF